MSIKKDEINKIKLEKFIEEQDKFNNLIDKQNKKIRNIVISFTVFILILSNITSAVSYTLAATEAESSQDANAENRAIGGPKLVGTIFSYMGKNVPFGYLACDGTKYNIADYPRLADHIKNHFGSYNYFGGDGTTTFAVPDLRGEFLRGTGNNSHTYGGTGAAVGVHQAPTKSPYIIAGSNRLSVYSNVSIYDTDTTQGSSKLRYANASSPTDYSYPNYYTNRPTNTSVLYLIKY